MKAGYTHRTQRNCHFVTVFSMKQLVYYVRTHRVTEIIQLIKYTFGSTPLWNVTPESKKVLYRVSENMGIKTEKKKT